MKCPKELRQCPHGWNDCNLCANYEPCLAGTYVPENELTESELTVDLSIPIAEEPAVLPTEYTASERGTWFDRFSRMSTRDRWAEIRRYPRPNFNEKEPYKAMAGAIVPGGGGKCKVPPKPPYKMPEYLKNWGQKP